MNAQIVKKSPRKPREPFHTDDDRYQAIVDKDARADGVFYFAVKTTGVYCRPTCAARLALRKNVAFFDTPDAAERAGYRPCKRCKPRELPLAAEHAALVERACKRIVEADGPLSLDALASAVGMSPSHFHRVFKSLTGLTPKAYASAHRQRRMRDALSKHTTVTSAIYNAGFNSSGRFYAASTPALGMTPTTFKAGGAGATIRFAVGQTQLGPILVAASAWGICAITLGDDADTLVRELQDRFPNATLIGDDREYDQIVARVVAFVERPTASLDLPLHVQGTAFQQRVWQVLSEIPPGNTLTYADVAARLGDAKAVRAVAGACAANTLAVAIPCHRVIRTDGSQSGYRWGVDRKAKLLEVERAMSRANRA